MKMAQGDLDGAISAFEKGVALEDTNNYTEPPDWPQSMRLYSGCSASKSRAVLRRQKPFFDATCDGIKTTAGRYLV